MAIPAWTGSPSAHVTRIITAIARVLRTLGGRRRHAVEPVNRPVDGPGADAVQKAAPDGPSSLPGLGLTIAVAANVAARPLTLGGGWVIRPLPVAIVIQGFPITHTLSSPRGRHHWAVMPRLSRTGRVRAAQQN